MDSAILDAGVEISPCKYTSISLAEENSGEAVRIATTAQQ